MVNWEWIKEYYGWIALTLGTIFIIVKVDLWVNGTETSAFLTAISPFVKDLISGALILALLILVGLYLREQD